MKIYEIAGAPHIFELKDGSDFRLFAREVKEIPDSKVSEQLYTAQKMGFIYMKKSPEEQMEIKELLNVPKTVSTKKKDGGAK